MATLEQYRQSDARKSSLNGDSQNNPDLFRTDEQVEEIESQALRDGTLINDRGHRQTFYFDAGVETGVCSGEFTQLIFVEITSGEFHGRPISKTALKQLGVTL